MASGPRTRTGCSSCRVRHLKCDEARPVCRRCQRSGRECVRGYNVRFRYGNGPDDVSAGKAAGDGDDDVAATPQTPGGRPATGKNGGEFRFESDQVWVQTGQVSFVDVTAHVTKNYDQTNLEGCSPPTSPQSSTAGTPTATFTPVLRSPGTPDFPNTTRRRSSVMMTLIADPQPNFTSINANPSSSPIEPARKSPLPPQPSQNHNRGGIALQDLLVSRSSSPKLSPPRSPPEALSEPCFPLRTEEEARLFAHYRDVLAPQLDVFTSIFSELPAIAAKNHSLLSALLALSYHVLKPSDQNPYAPHTPSHNVDLQLTIHFLYSLAGLCSFSPQSYQNDRFTQGILATAAWLYPSTSPSVNYDYSLPDHSYRALRFLAPRSNPTLHDLGNWHSSLTPDFCEIWSKRYVGKQQAASWVCWWVAKGQLAGSDEEREACRRSVREIIRENRLGVGREIAGWIGGLEGALVL